MASLADLIAALPAEDGWGPPATTETTLNGVPYAPFSKGDKLGRMADWTADSKSERGGRQQYQRNYRGENHRFPARKLGILTCGRRESPAWERTIRLFR